MRVQRKVIGLKHLPDSAPAPTSETGFAVWHGGFYMGARRHGAYLRDLGTSQDQVRLVEYDDERDND